MTACSSKDDNTTPAEPDPPATPATPFAVRVPQANWPLTADQQAMQLRLNDFAFRLFRETAQTGNDDTENSQKATSIVLSPLSVGYALGMAALACDGKPLADFNQMMGLEANDSATVHDLFASLMAHLPEMDASVAIHLANAFYYNANRTDIQLNQAYRQALITAYGADCEAMPFTDDATLDHINDWCNRQTNGFIPKVLEKKDMMNPNLVSYLLNAIYFKGKWASQFESELTREEDFTCEDGTKVKVPMMCLPEASHFTYAEDSICQAVRLPYHDWESHVERKGEFGMTVLLPQKGKTIDDILSVLSAHWLKNLETRMLESGYSQVMVQLPRFETKVQISLTPPMRQLGLASWLDGDNILGMVQELNGSPHGVHVSKAFQVARIKVNESGTEAGAVTVMAFTDKAMLEDPIFFRADHPFVYLLTEKSTGSILFVGTYVGD